MQFKERHQVRSNASQPKPASFGLLALLLAAGSAAFGACGDDGSLLGSDNGAGTAGQAGQGGSGNTSSAGSGLAGKQAGGGNTSNGGTAGAGGTTSNGGTAGTGGATCETGLCIRPNVCLDECDGDVVYTGCCQCEAGTVEQLSCSANGGQGSGGQASSACVGATCTSNQTCVAYRTIGGVAPPPPDAQGDCEAGRHAEGNYCQPDFGYTCAELSGCSAPAATCRCAPNTQCAGTTVCRLPSDSPWLDTSADLVCELLAP